MTEVIILGAFAIILVLLAVVNRGSKSRGDAGGATGSGVGYFSSDSGDFGGGCDGGGGGGE